MILVTKTFTSKTLASKSVRQTQKLAADLAQKTVSSKPLKHACVFALEGELGVGKTTFVQGFARVLKIKQRITSPTFVLMRNYKLQVPNYKFFYHIDAFRLKDWRDLALLGAKEILADPANIILIEWAERIRPILPRNCAKIHIDHISKTVRKITVSGFSSLTCDRT